MEPQPPSSLPTRPWRIAFFRRRFSPTGGAERYLLRLAAGLQSEGHNLTLYCEEWTPRETPFHQVCLVDAKDPVSFAQKVWAMPLKNRHDLLFSLERVPGMDIYRAGDGVHADWLALREKASPFLGKLRSRLRRKNREVCQLESRVFDQALTGRVICNSQMVAQQISRRFNFPPERLDLVPNGVPYQLFSQGDRSIGRQALHCSPQDFVVLLVGAGQERKGHHLARAMVQASQVPNRKLILVDHPPSVAMPHVYAAADAFLLPSLYDPFANVTLEALAAGLPVITSAQNGAAEILTPGKNGFVLSSPDNIAQGAAWLRDLSDPNYRRGFSLPAQKLAQEYDLSRNLRETLQVFARVKRRGRVSG